MLYIQKEGKTLHIVEAHKAYVMHGSLEAFLNARLKQELTTLQGRQSVLKHYAPNRYLVPLYINATEVYLFTRPKRAMHTVLLNTVRIISVEAHPHGAHILFDQGTSLTLPENPTRLKRRWMESLHFTQKLKH